MGEFIEICHLFIILGFKRIELNSFFIISGFVESKHSIISFEILSNPVAFPFLRILEARFISSSDIL